MPAERQPADSVTLHKESIVIDTCAYLLKSYGDYQEDSGITAVQITAAHPEDIFDGAIRSVSNYMTAAAADHRLQIIARAEEILRLKAEGRVGVILTLQNSSPIGNQLDLADTFYQLGVRVVQLTYNARNHAADGCCEVANAGLSRFGTTLIRRLNELGVVVDLSHVGERSSLQAIDASARPCIFSHSSPKTLFPNPRNITDNQIKAVAARGGVVGICSWAVLCWDGSSRQPAFDDFLRAIDYVVELVGPGHIAIGTDSMASVDADPVEVSRWLRGTPYPEVMGKYYEQFSTIEDKEHLEDFKGMRDLQKLTSALLNRGYPPRDVQKILGENMLRVYREVWQ